MGHGCTPSSGRAPRRVMPSSPFPPGGSSGLAPATRRGTASRGAAALLVAAVLAGGLLLLPMVGRATDCSVAFDVPTCQSVQDVNGSVQQGAADLGSRVSVVAAKVDDMRTLVGWSVGISLLALAVPFIRGILRDRS